MVVVIVSAVLFVIDSIIDIGYVICTGAVNVLASAIIVGIVLSIVLVIVLCMFLLVLLLVYC